MAEGKIIKRKASKKKAVDAKQKSPVVRRKNIIKKSQVKAKTPVTAKVKKSFKAVTASNFEGKLSETKLAVYPESKAPASMPAKKDIPAVQSSIPSQPLAKLPSGEWQDKYGDNRIVLLVRDPHWIFAYWEIMPSIIEDIARQIDLSKAQMILRVYDITDKDFNGYNANSSFDIGDLKGADNWYINVGGAYRDYIVDIGFLAADGSFRVIARSNMVRTPRENMSDEIDAAWMTVDFEKLYLLSGGYDIGRSSGEINELLARRMKEMLFSGGISSFSGRK